jgi:hypothetical protein
MTWEYISGFFDADGSIGYYAPSKGQNKTAFVSFHNNEKSIINKIQKFIESELGSKGSLSTKKPRELNHNLSYNLLYSNKVAIEISRRLVTVHPKKRHRINILSKIAKLVPRNGKYTDELKDKIAELELLYK